MSENSDLSERFRELENKRGLLTLVEADAGFYNIKKERDIGADSTARTVMSLMTAIANIVVSICVARACLINLGLQNAADVLAIVAIIVLLEWFAVALWILRMEYDDIVRERESRIKTNKWASRPNKKSQVTIEELN